MDLGAAMSVYGQLTRLEHSCVQPGLWLIEGHQVRKLPHKNATSINPRGIQWLVVRLNGGGNIVSSSGLRTHPTFADAVDTITDHIDKGCDCP
jgi:hypothetical protein